MHRTLVREIQKEASGERHPVHGQGTQCGDVCQSSHHGLDSIHSVKLTAVHFVDIKNISLKLI